MAYCSKCGAQVNDGDQFCPACGEPVGASATSGTNDTLMGVLSYLGLLALIPYFSKGQSSFVRAHAIRGMNLLLLEIIAGVASGILSFVPVLGTIVGWLISLASLAFTIIGIVNVANHKDEDLPLIGTIRFIKN